MFEKNKKVCYLHEIDLCVWFAYMHMYHFLMLLLYKYISKMIFHFCIHIYRMLYRFSLKTEISKHANFLSIALYGIYLVEYIAFQTLYIILTIRQEINNN